MPGSGRGKGFSNGQGSYARAIGGVVGDEAEDHLEGVGAVVVVGFWEVAQLVDELRLVPAEPYDPVLYVRLHFGDAQDFIGIGADALDRQVQSPLRAFFDDPILEQFLKLDLLDPGQSECDQRGKSEINNHGCRIHRPGGFPVPLLPKECLNVRW